MGFQLRFDLSRGCGCASRRDFGIRLFEDDLIEHQVAIGFDGNGVGGFELGEDFLAAFAGSDMNFVLGHFLGIEQALVIGGESFGVEAVVALSGAR